MKLKPKFGTPRSLIWLFTSVAIFVIFTVVTILSTTVFYSIFCVAFGAERRIVDESGSVKRFTTEFTTKEEARENGEAVNELICEEGFVLLKNNGVLPMTTSADAKKTVSIFGKNSVSLVIGGSGSGAGSGEYAKTLYQSLAAANYDCNPELESFYKNNDQSGAGRSDNPELDPGTPGATVSTLETGETPQGSYTPTVKNSYAQYNDLALIVFSRIGGEGFDLPNVATSNGYADAHYLQLDKNEKALIDEVCSNFENVVVVINSSTPIELGFLNDTTHYAYNAGIDAAVWVGAPGDTGIMSLGKILNGAVSPSGRLPDTYAKNFKNDPTYANFAAFTSNSYTGGNGSSSLIRKFVDYEEGIYIGYRYYVTRGYEEKLVDPASTWYNDNVAYSFGEGLSYATFTQTITNKGDLNNKPLTADSTIEININVTNTSGTVAGKETVQVYVTTPYTKGGIEKSYVTLAGYAKTELIQPGATVPVTVSIDPYYFASYDFSGLNSASYKGYLLEADTYTFRLARNANVLDSANVFDSFDQTLASVYRFDSTGTQSEVKNRFDDADDELVQKLSRANFAGTMPQSRTTAERAIRTEVNDRINSFATNNPFTTTEVPIYGKEGNLTLEDVVDKPYDADVWKDLIEQITFEDMVNLVGEGGFKTVAIMSIGKPKTTDADGPMGFVNFIAVLNSPMYGTAFYACLPISAATFNTALTKKLGDAVGNEALIGDLRGDGAPYSGWYAPGVNLHRSPFGGRVGEYYSEDPFLAGMQAANLIQGAKAKGVYTQVKHFAVNEQETDRGGICTWLTEQALREVYLRPFEMAVKIGKTQGMMSSFNRIGAMWTGGDYRLLTEVLRNEWGFEGMVICDYNTGSHMNAEQMHFAGGDLNLQTGGQAWSPRKSNATQISILQKCTKNILFTVAGSNAMNDKILGYNLPVWTVVLIIVDVVVFVGLLVWGFFAIFFGDEKKKKNNPN